MAETKVLIDPDGDRYEVPAANVQKALSQGFRYESRAETRQRERKDKYGTGAANELLAAAAGAARTATFGLSDAIAVVRDNIQGTQTGAALKGLEENNPLSTVAGEIGGLFIDPLTMGANIGAKVGIKGSEALAKASRAGFAEILAKKIIPDAAAAIPTGARTAEGIEKFLASEAGQLGVKSEPRKLQDILEGLNKKAPANISDAAKEKVALEIYGKEVSKAEELRKLSFVESLGGAEKAAETVAPLKNSFGRNLSQKVLSGSFQGMAQGVAQSLSEDALGNHELNAEKLLASIANGALFGGGLSGAFAVGEHAVMKGIQKVFSNKKTVEGLEKFAAKEAFSSFKPFRNEIRETMSKPGGITAMGKEIIDNKFHKSYPTWEAKIEDVRRVKDEVGAKLGRIIEETDTRIGPLNGARLSRELIVDLRKLERNPLFTHEVAPLIKDAKRFAKFNNENPLRLADLHIFRQQLDDKINFLKLNKNPLEKSVIGIREKLESNIKNNIEKALGGQAVNKYQEIKDKYSRLSLIAKMTERQTAGNATKSFITGLDTFAMGGHAALSVLTGNPGVFLGGAGVTMASRYLRNNGQALAADAASKLAKLNFISKKVQDTDQRVQSLIRSFVKKPTLVRTVLKASEIANRNKEYAKEQEQITKLAANPDVFAQHLERSFPGMANAAPQITMHTNAKMGTAIKKLSQTFQKPLGTENFIKIKKDPPLRDTQKYRLKTQMRVVKNPLSVLEDLNSGQVTKEAVNTLKEVYPNLYDDIRYKMIAEVTANPESITYEKRLHLSHLFGATLDASLEPGFKAMMQKSYATQEQQKPQQGIKTSKGPVTNPENTQSEISRITYG